MSLSIRRATPCFALIVAVLVAACSGGDPVSPASRTQTQVPSLNKARVKRDTATTDTTTAAPAGATSSPTNTKCPPPVVTEGTSPTDSVKSDSTKTTKRCADTSPWA